MVVRCVQLETKSCVCVCVCVHACARVCVRVCLTVHPQPCIKCVVCLSVKLTGEVHYDIDFGDLVENKLRAIFVDN